LIKEVFTDIAARKEKLLQRGEELLMEQWLETPRSYAKEESLVQDALPELTNALTLLLDYRPIWKSEESRAFDLDAMNIFYSAYRANVNALKICYECERNDLNRHLK
jgi:hypothetical protein